MHDQATVSLTYNDHMESVKVCEFFLEFRFKSGVTISIEK